MRLTLTLLLLLLGAVPLAAQQRAPITVILVRHAEKAASPANDPPLTAEGEERARALAKIARNDGVQAIITTQYLRTRETARPAAEALHITPEVVSVGTGAPAMAQHIREVVRRIAQDHQGQVVLVVEHSNTIPAIIAALGAPKPAAICDNEYDGLYTVFIAPTGATTVMKSRYGAPSAVTAGCESMMKR
jgi:broad specificity phosphatase PhoE